MTRWRIMVRVSASDRLRRWAQSPRSDAALAVLAAVAQLWPLLSRDGPWQWWGYVAAVGSALPLVARRIAPLPVVVASYAFSASYDLVDPVASQPLWYGPFIALYTVSARSGRWSRWGTIAVIICGGLLTVGSADTALRGVVLAVTAYALGRAAAGTARTPPSWRSAPPGSSRSGPWRPSGPPNANAPGSPATCTTSWRMRSPSWSCRPRPGRS